MQYTQPRVIIIIGVHSGVLLHFILTLNPSGRARKVSHSLISSVRSSATVSRVCRTPRTHIERERGQTRSSLRIFVQTICTDNKYTLRRVQDKCTSLVKKKKKIAHFFFFYRYYSFLAGTVVCHIFLSRVVVIQLRIYCVCLKKNLIYVLCTCIVVCYRR